AEARSGGLGRGSRTLAWRRDSLGLRKTDGFQCIRQSGRERAWVQRTISGREDRSIVKLKGARPGGIQIPDDRLCDNPRRQELVVMPQCRVSRSRGLRSGNLVQIEISRNCRVCRVDHLATGQSGGQVYRRAVQVMVEIKESLIY